MPDPPTIMGALPPGASSTIVIDVTEVPRKGGLPDLRDETPHRPGESEGQPVVSRPFTEEVGATRCQPTQSSEASAKETIAPLPPVSYHPHMEPEMSDDPTENGRSDARAFASAEEFDRWFSVDEGSGSRSSAGWVSEAPSRGLNQLAAKIQDLSESLVAALAHQRALLDEADREATDAAAAARVQVSRDAIAAVTSATSQYLQARAAADAVRLDLDRMLAVALEGACQIVADAEESAASLIDQARASVATMTSGGESDLTIDLRERDGSVAGHQPRDPRHS